MVYNFEIKMHKTAWHTNIEVEEQMYGDPTAATHDEDPACDEINEEIRKR